MAVHILTLSSGAFGGRGEGGAGGEGDADTLTPLACLLWADVGVVCPTAIADLIKSEETHHFIWLSASFGLALIQ